MKPVDRPEAEYKTLVRDGYDECASDYLAARETGPAMLAPLLGRLTPGADVLDLGCGCGVPVAKTLALHHTVTGVDFSRSQLALARANVPSATFLESDLTDARFAPDSFDAVVALYVIFHMPRAEQLELLRSIWTWLKPAGYLFATFSHFNEAAYTEEFFGVEMFWTNFALDEYLRFLTDLGFELRETSVQTHGYDDDHPPESHPLVLAQKPIGRPE